jgi:two-component system, response regulator FlrC
LSEVQASILVVVDDPEMSSAVCEVLRQAGYLSRSAQSGSEALAIVRREPPDLVISDLRMAEMSGHQLQQQLQAMALMCQ